MVFSCDHYWETPTHTTVKLLKHIVKLKIPIRILGLHFLDQSVQSDDIRIQQPQNDAGVYIDIFLLYLGPLL